MMDASAAPNPPGRVETTPTTAENDNTKTTILRVSQMELDPPQPIMEHCQPQDRGKKLPAEIKDMLLHQAQIGDQSESQPNQEPE